MPLYFSCMILIVLTHEHDDMLLLDNVLVFVSDNASLLGGDASLVHGDASLVGGYMVLDERGDIFLEVVVYIIFKLDIARRSIIHIYIYLSVFF
jgi:hypothetical protein